MDKMIMDSKLLVEIVSEDYKLLSGMDMVVIPASSTLYPLTKGPRELYKVAGRTKMNELLKKRLIAYKKPYRIGESVVFDA